MIGIATGFLLALSVSAVKPVEQAARDPRDTGPQVIDVSSYPEINQRQYALVSVKCKKCHPLARYIGSDFDAATWKLYMKRMLRRPNAGVTEDQAREIYDFLKYRSSLGGPKIHKNISTFPDNLK